LPPAVNQPIITFVPQGGKKSFMRGGYVEILLGFWGSIREADFSRLEKSMPGKADLDFSLQGDNKVLVNADINSPDLTGKTAFLLDLNKKAPVIGYMKFDDFKLNGFLGEYLGSLRAAGNLSGEGIFFNDRSLSAYFAGKILNG